MDNGIRVCYSRCWPCTFEHHMDPPGWHSWADEEDVEHAESVGRDVAHSRCGCWCAEVEPL